MNIIFIINSHSNPKFDSLKNTQKKKKSSDNISLFKRNMMNPPLKFHFASLYKLLFRKIPRNIEITRNVINPIVQ